MPVPSKLQDKIHTSKVIDGQQPNDVTVKQNPVCFYTSKSDANNEKCLLVDQYL
jgi:hypothetical protein